MKKLLCEYSKIIGMTFTGGIFGLAFFLLFLNIYHMKEISTTYTKTENDKIALELIHQKLVQARQNLSYFNPNSYGGNNSAAELSAVQAELNACTQNFEDQSLTDILNKETIDIKDVYELQKLFQNSILGECIVKRTYNLTGVGMDAKYSIQGLETLAPFLKLQADSLLDSTSYVNRLLENNSTYTISSDYAKNNFVEMTRDSYNEILKAYTDSADYILYLSEWFLAISGGVR